MGDRPKFSMPHPDIHVDTDSPGCGEFATGFVVVVLVIAWMGFATGAIPQIWSMIVGQ
jgi:hypothetical protein